MYVLSSGKQQNGDICESILVSVLHSMNTCDSVLT